MEVYDALDRILERQEDRSAAVAVWRRVTAANREDGRAWFHLARAERAAGSANEALNAYGKAAQFLTGDQTPLMEWGQLLMDLGRYREAIEPLREWARREVHSSLPHTLLIRCYLQTKEYDRVWKVVEQCRAVGLSFPQEFMDELAGILGRRS